MLRANNAMAEVADIVKLRENDVIYNLTITNVIITLIKYADDSVILLSRNLRLQANRNCVLLTVNPRIEAGP